MCVCGEEEETLPSAEVFVSSIVCLLLGPEADTATTEVVYRTLGHEFADLVGPPVDR